mgnify:CR=1 FL=1
MESIDVMITNFDFEALDREIKRTMRRSAKDAIQIGYMLKQMRDKKLWEIRYTCLDEYLTQELGIDYTMASRFINLNNKYSWNGNSMEIAERYKDYSQGLLIEMLSMPKELEEKVTPNMTIRQVREIKKQDKQKKNPIPEVAEVIIDGEYREVEEKKKEMVATSQFLEKGVAGCALIPEQSDKQITRDDELSMLRRLLEEKKKELHECVKVNAVDPLPEEYIWERKVVVGALASMLCGLEDVEEQSEQEPEQPKLPLLKNNDQRKEWLANYRNWGLWYRDEHIDVNYYKFDFLDGSRLIAVEYPQRHSYWKKNQRSDEVYYHLLEKNCKGYKFGYDKQYIHGADSESYLVDFLKNLQKGNK